jgi:phosphopantothenoylcysteine decarboxylase/phosphopantothenate--cysteine ligase
MNVLLAISGGIAAYKPPALVRRLRERGHAVRCLRTADAGHIVADGALVALSGQPVATTMWPGDGTMPHIDLVRWCDGFLLAPATAHTLARLALGLADDLLATAFLALEPSKPVWIAPAMNTVMWEKPAVQQHVHTLSERGARFIPPVDGSLACGEEGAGAMADPTHIATVVSGSVSP